MEINNMMDVIDSRDIIERIEELEESLREEFEAEDSPLTFEEYIDVTHFEGDTEAYEYKTLLALAEQCTDYVQDWEYGVGLIRYSYFTEYCRELVADCGDIPSDLPWYIADHINWEGVARDLSVDYTEVDFNGVVYYVR